MKSPLLLCLALLASTVPAWAQPSPLERALHLVRIGHRGEAIELLQGSELDSRGNFVLAGLLAEERKMGRVCDSGAYRETILKHIGDSLSQDPKVRKKVLADGRFVVVHDTFGWQALLGREPSRDSDIKPLLERVSFYGPPQGVYGDTAFLRFRPGGRVAGWEHVWDEKADTVRRAPLSGTYSVDGRKVTLRLGKDKVWRGELGKDGQLTIEGRGVFTDAPTECDV